MLFHGEKIVKIGPVYPEIFDKIRQFFGHVIPDVYKLFGCHGNIPRDIGKCGTDPSSTHTELSYGEKI